MKAFLAGVACVFLSGTQLLDAQEILLGWDLPENSASASVLSVTNVSAVVGPVSMALGSGVGPSARTGGWGGTWAGGGSEFANNNLEQFFGFQVTAASGKKITVTGISRLSLQSSPSGPAKWNLLAGTSGVTSTFLSPLRNYGPFAVSNPPTSVAYTDITAAISNGIAGQPVVILPGQTVFFRLIGWGGSGNSTGRITSTNSLPSLDFALTGMVEDVGRTNQTILFPSLGRRLFGDDPFPPGAVASSGLPVSYASSDPAVAEFSNNLLVIKKIGSTTITASQPGNGVYDAAPYQTQVLTVSLPAPSDYLTARYAVATNPGIPFRTTNDYKGVSTNLALDLYRRTNPPPFVQPVVVLIHGGGYNASLASADRTQSYIVSLANQLASRGFQCLSIDYRLRASADRSTDALQLPALRDAAADSLEALKFVRTHAGTYGWDTNAIFMLGGSAGGRIAAWLAVRESGDQAGLSTADPKSTTIPASSVTSDATAVYDRGGLVASAILFGGPEDVFRAYTVDSSDLPCVLIHGTYDGNTSQTGSVDTYGSVDLYNQLVSVGVPSELHLLNGYGHQFDTSLGAYASVDAIPAAADLAARFFVKQWDRRLSGGTEAFAPGISRAGGTALSLRAPLASQNAPGTTYQWKRQGTNLPGETNPTLVLANLQATDNGNYSVTVGNPDQSWPLNQISILGFSNTPMVGIQFIKTGLNNFSNHPVTLTLSVASVTVPSFAESYPGQNATGDPDGDGYPALAEYAFGGNSLLGTAEKNACLPQLGQSGGRLVLSYQVRTNDPKVAVMPETATDLAATNWALSGITVNSLGGTNVGGEMMERRSASVPLDGARRFLRLKAVLSP